MSAGHIQRRGESSWRLKYDLGRDPTTGKRIIKFKTVRGSKRDAQRELRNLLDAVDQGRHVDPGKLTLGQYLDEWLEGRGHALASKTAERYGDHIRDHIKPEIGHIHLAKLTALNLNGFYARMLKSGRLDGRGGLASRTVWHFDRLLHKALRDAVRQRLIAFNPADEVERPKVEKRRPTTLTPAGFLELLKVAEGTRQYAAIVLIFTGGVRRGELLALRDRDFHLDSSKVEIVRSLSETKAKGLFFKEPKSKSSIRRITLPASTVEVLRRHRLALMQDRLKLGLGWSEEVLLFGTVDGNPIRPRNFTKEFCRLAKKAGLVGISPHAGRHGHLTQLLELEVHPKIAQARAGHASIAVTLDIYSHVTDSMQGRAAERINAELQAALVGKV